MTVNSGSGDGRETGDQPSASERGPEAPSTSSETLLERAEREPTGVAQLAGLRRPISISAIMQTGIFIMLLLAVVYFAQPVLLPVALAVLLNFLLAPFVRWAQDRGIPRPLSAVALVGALAAGLLTSLYLLSSPASQFLDKARHRMEELEDKLRTISEPVEDVQETAQQVEEATTAQPDAPEVAVREPGFIRTALGYAQSFGAGVLAAVILLLFLLCSDEVFLHKLVRVLPTLHDKRLAVEIFRQIEQDISYYLLTITVINIGLGISAGLLFWLVGMPAPAMWGVLVGVLNFVPYLGPTVAMLVLALVGLISFDSVGVGVLPPLIVLGLNLVEANIITPVALGRRLDLNPVMIFLSLAFWGFLWGIAGMVIAVPLLVMFKTVCDHVKPLAPLSEFLSGTEPPAGEDHKAEEQT